MIMSIMKLQKNCSECNALLINDTNNGELICSSCGIVVMEQLVYHGPEIKNIDTVEKMKNSRATGQTTYSQHDLGISTDISISSKDFNGKPINSQMANQMNNLRKWQQRVRISTSKERRLANVLTKINEICQNMSLSKNILETASRVYRNIDSKINVKGKSITSIAITAVYIACKQCNVIRSLEEICKHTSSHKEMRSKVKLASRYYRVITMEIGNINLPILAIDKYISKIANITNTGTRVERLALEISDKTKNYNTAEGKSPNGIAAAYLYISATLLGHNILQKDVSQIAGVTEVTIRNRCREILTNNKLKLIIKPQIKS